MIKIMFALVIVSLLSYSAVYATIVSTSTVWSMNDSQIIDNLQFEHDTPFWQHKTFTLPNGQTRTRIITLVIPYEHRTLKLNGSDYIVGTYRSTMNISYNKIKNCLFRADVNVCKQQLLFIPYHQLKSEKERALINQIRQDSQSITRGTEDDIFGSAGAVR